MAHLTLNNFYYVKHQFRVREQPQEQSGRESYPVMDKLRRKAGHDTSRAASEALHLPEIDEKSTTKSRITILRRRAMAHHKLLRIIGLRGHHTHLEADNRICKKQIHRKTIYALRPAG